MTRSTDLAVLSRVLRHAGALPPRRHALCQARRQFSRHSPARLAAVAVRWWAYGPVWGPVCGPVCGPVWGQVWGQVWALPAAGGGLSRNTTRPPGQRGVAHWARPSRQVARATAPTKSAPPVSA